MPNKKILYALLSFFMLLLWLPLLQQQLKIVDSGKLNGMVMEDTARPPLSLHSWFDGAWQQGLNNEVQHNIGFRTDFIHLADQVNFSLFRKTNAKVVIGRHNNLFEQSYIDAYLGRDFKGEAMIRERVRMMKYIQDTLDKLGKKFILLYAPSKARYMPEDIPGYVASPGKTWPSNYATYLRLGDSIGLRQIDFNGWFAARRYKAKHELFTRSSIHWTTYGALLAADSFQRFMKERCGQQNIPDITWNDDEAGAIGGPSWSEDDLEKLLNIMTHVGNRQFFHPEIRLRPEHMEHRPRAIYVGDSFMWMWINLNVPQRLNDSMQFWSYYYELWTPERTTIGHVRQDIDPMKEILKTDWIVLLYTEANFEMPGGSFPEEAYKYFSGKQANQ